MNITFTTGTAINEDDREWAAFVYCCYFYRVLGYVPAWAIRPAKGGEKEERQ